MAAADLRQAAAAPVGEPSVIRREEMMAGMMGGASSAAGDNGTSLIARAEALNAFMKLQPAANEARARPPPAGVPTSPGQPAGCFCIGSRVAASAPQELAARPRREYYPDNLSVQPKRHKWGTAMEWLILACVDLLERDGLDERNIFAVSAVEDLVSNMHVPVGERLPNRTDPHVAAGVIKAQIRHADEPVVPKEALRAYIEVQQAGDAAAGQAAETYMESHLVRTLQTTEAISGRRRAYVQARILRLLGRVSANAEISNMNAHCLAKCVAPSMLHWDPNSGFALLMLGKITAFVMALIDEARVFDENLCQTVVELESNE